MTNVIWKYELVPIQQMYCPQKEVQMPKGATIIHFDRQGQDFCLWARVNPEAEIETRTFVIQGTGFHFDPSMIYHKTLLEGIFVWHLLEATHA